VAVIHVVVSDKGISVAYHAEEARGVIAEFEIVNKGHRTHSFSLLGKTTGHLKPGEKAAFRVTLLHRGVFTYRSTVDSGAAFHGNFIVY
jgi:hypothetical protein